VRRFATTCLTVAAIAVLPVSVAAQEGTTEDARKRFETDRRKLEATQRRSNELQSELEKVAAEINTRLAELGKEIQQSEPQMSLIESRLVELEARKNVLRGTLEQQREWFSAWVAAAMNRTGENPLPLSSSKREDVAAMVSRAMALATTFPEQREQVLAFVGQFNELVYVEELIRIERDKLRTGTARLCRLLPWMAAKQQAGPQAEMSEDRSPEVLLTPGRIKPAVPFGEARGLLPLPAQGRRVLTFGEKTQYGSQSRGLVLETRYGGQVVSPSEGWIVYAGEFRSYGQLVIINAGGGYHIFLAGLSQIDVQLGQFVLTGEPVGVMRAAAKSSTDAQDNAPILYIEFRKDERPVDPDPWFR